MHLNWLADPDRPVPAPPVALQPDGTPVVALPALPARALGQHPRRTPRAPHRTRLPPPSTRAAETGSSRSARRRRPAHPAPDHPQRRPPRRPPARTQHPTRRATADRADPPRPRTAPRPGGHRRNQPADRRLAAGARRGVAGRRAPARPGERLFAPAPAPPEPGLGGCRLLRVPRTVDRGGCPHRPAPTNPAATSPAASPQPRSEPADDPEDTIRQLGRRHPGQPITVLLTAALTCLDPNPDAAPTQDVHRDVWLHRI